MDSGSGVVRLQAGVRVPASSQIFRSRVSSDPLAAQGLRAAVKSLLDMAVVCPVSPAERGLGYYSNLFTEPKKDGSVRPILDLKLLNRFIRPRKFRMETLRSAINSLRQGDFMTSIDQPIGDRHQDGGSHSGEIRLGDQLSQVLPLSVQGGVLSGNVSGFFPTQSVSSSLQGSLDSGIDSASFVQPLPVYQAGNEAGGIDGGLVRGGSLCSVSHKDASASSVGGFGPVSKVVGSVLPDVLPGLAVSSVVAGSGQSLEGSVFSAASLGDRHHGCQSVGVGRFLEGSSVSGAVGASGGPLAHQCSGAESHQVGSVSLDTAVTGLAGSSSVGQSDGGCLHQSPGRDSQLECPQGGVFDSGLGREPCPLHLGGVHPGRGEHGGGLSEQVFSPGGNGLSIPSFDMFKHKKNVKAWVADKSL
ncbi:uncharacterized protein PAF06_002475 [Gastrophryne carolinensis]